MVKQNDQFGKAMQCIQSLEKIKKAFNEQCTSFNIMTPKPQQSLRQQNARNKEFRGRYFSLREAIGYQLAHPHFANAMHFMRMVDPGAGLHIYDQFIKIKLARDGFLFKNHRCSFLSCFSNCSIRHLENSRNNCVLMAMGDFTENRLNLSQVCQYQDIETHLARLFGFIDPRNGCLVNVLAVQVEDSGCMEKSLGRDKASSGKWRFLWSSLPRLVHNEWKTTHVPICVDAKFCHRQWQKLLAEKVGPYCRRQDIQDIHLAEFVDSKDDPQIAEHIEQFEKIMSYIHANKDSSSGMIGDWNRADCIWSFGLDGLHCELRICNHTVKYFMKMVFEYEDYVRENPHVIAANHGEIQPEDYPLQSFEDLKRHFRDRCSIPFKYD